MKSIMGIIKYKNISLIKALGVIGLILWTLSMFIK
jgi:hypothetical protein